MHSLLDYKAKSLQPPLTGQELQICQPHPHWKAQLSESSLFTFLYSVITHVCLQRHHH